MHKLDLLPWRMFTVDFQSKDKPITDTVRSIAEENADQLVDLRPYLI